jgi:hypothetical protein
MDEIVLYIILGICVIAILIQWFFIDNLLNQNKQLEDTVAKSLKANDKLNEDVEKYHRVLQGVYANAYAEIMKVDKKGSFSSDDEIGWAFSLIRDTVKDITEKLNNMKRTDEEKE